MRTLILAFMALGSAAGLQSAPQTIMVSPSSLDGWTVAGSVQAEASPALDFSLASGTQLSRQFQTQGLEIHLTSQLQIGKDSGDWPVLEIGSIALLFSRNESEGKLFLVVGENTPIEVPIALTLDPEGRAVDPLTLSFAVKDSVVIIQSSGKTFTFPADSAKAKALELVVSAGDDTPWLINALEVIADSNDGASGAGGTLLDNSSGSVVPSSTTTDQASADSDGLNNSNLTMVTAIIPTTTKPTPAIDTSTTLEVFTPPAVRRARVDSLRASMVRSIE